MLPEQGVLCNDDVDAHPLVTRSPDPRELLDTFKIRYCSDESL